MDKDLFWTDSHAHLYSAEFKGDRADMLERAQSASIGKMVMPNVDHRSIDEMLELESRWPQLCFATMGLHPCSVTKDFQRELYLVEEWLSKRAFTAIGEIGTDMYWDKTLWDEQKEAFEIQVSWAKQYGLPIIIHCRETIDETIALVESNQDGRLKGVFHCFTGTREQAEKIMKLGFYLGIGGVSTFKKSPLDTVIPELPLDRLLVETDSPYLAPVPYRGKRNEPSYIPLIGERIATLKRLRVEDVRQQTTANLFDLFPATRS